MDPTSTNPSDILQNDKINSRWLGLRKLPERLLAGGFCYRYLRGAAKAQKHWVKKIRISVGLTVDGRVWSRTSEILIPQRGGHVLHGGWHYVKRIDVTDADIVALTNEWIAHGYMVRLPRNARIRAEVVVAALQEHA